MKEDKLRKIILSNHGALKHLILKDSQLPNLILIPFDDPGMTSSKFAFLLGVSVQNASQKLRILYGKGYLSREEVPSGTGGIEFVYKRRI